MTTPDSASIETARRHMPVRAWLFAVAFLVFAMVIVGGATRSTDSGLSITEWKPIIGALPPLSAGDWHEAFDKYRQTPEYKIVNRGMNLDQFKVIFWWEWAHRFLGRFVGVAFLLPFVFFWASGRLERRDVPKLAGLFVLGGLQGGLGWYMVKSGLVDRVDVSQYRLAAHLTLAAVIFAALLWTALQIGQKPRTPRSLAAILVLAILVQVALGGLVAGLDAGLAYNTWPLMAGFLIPPDLGLLDPWWLNIFENTLTVQFQHRLMAYVLVVLVSVAFWQSPRAPSAVLMIAMILAQTGLGIWTLLAEVPMPLGLGHQAGAMIVLAASIWHMHQTAPVRPVQA